ncbi:MAG TPA: hypothetical protein DCX46_12080 [Bacteroidetes bacterium]|nr:hypothetical protein [Bacteroidota bacterium]
MKNLIRHLILPLVCVTGVAIGQQFNKGGRTAFQFVKIGIGARQVALGEANIASIRDINSVFWNPAGISGIGDVEASFSYARWFADLHYNAGAAGFRWQDVGTFAVSYASLDYGQIPEALVALPSGSSDTRTGSTFGGGDVLIGVSYARALTDQLSIGVTAKLLQEKLFTYNVSLAAFDVGTYYDIGYKGIRLAMAAQNLAGSVKWLSQSDRDEGYDIPLLFRVGTSVDLIHEGNSFLNLGPSHRLTVLADALHSNDYAERLHVGAEYTFNDFVALRLGHRFNYEEGDWSVGLGVKQDISGIGVRIDYAFVSYKHLESPHRLTVSIVY